MVGLLVVGASGVRSPQCTPRCMAPEYTGAWHLNAEGFLLYVFTAIMGARFLTGAAREEPRGGRLVNFPAFFRSVRTI